MSTRPLTSPSIASHALALLSFGRDVPLKTFKLSLGRGAVSPEVPGGGDASWSPRATKVALGRFVGSVSDDWALSARAPDTFSHLRAPRMAEPLRSGPLAKARQGSAAEQMVPTWGAAWGGWDPATPPILPSIPAAPSPVERKNYPLLQDNEENSDFGLLLLPRGSRTDIC